MNNQMLTKLNVKNAEIANLQKENNFLKNQLKSTKNDLFQAVKANREIASELQQECKINNSIIDTLQTLKLF